MTTILSRQSLIARDQEVWGWTLSGSRLRPLSVYPEATDGGGGDRTSRCVIHGEGGGGGGSLRGAIRGGHRRRRSRGGRATGAATTGALASRKVLMGDLKIAVKYVSPKFIS